MPSYGVHRAVGVVYLSKNKVNDSEAFMQGIVKPDVLSDVNGLKKMDTHFGYFPRGKPCVKNEFKSKTNLYRYLVSCEPKSDEDMGYFLHLVTDHLWFYRFLYKKEMEQLYNKKDMAQTYNKKTLYHDYACIAKEVEKVYHVPDGLPTLTWKTIDDEPIYFSRRGMHEFIKYCGGLNLKKLKVNILEAKQHWADVSLLANCPQSKDFM